MTKAVFLDRDGTINEDVDYLNNPDGLVILPTVIDALRLLLESGYILVIVTNQSGVARGYFTEIELGKINTRLEEILKENGYDEEKIEKIKHCILAHRYRSEIKPKSREAKILFDADKLDSIGAIGVARAFVWVGRNNAKIYSNVDLKEYMKFNLGGKINGRIKEKTIHSPQIEFNTKLKYIPNKIFTNKAKKIAQKRIHYMRDFFCNLEKEIQGE